MARGPGAGLRAAALGAAAFALWSGPVPAEASAQVVSAADMRQGSWSAVRMGGGIDGVICEICLNRPRPGMALSLRHGGTASPSVRWGGEFTAWTRRDDGTRQWMAGLMAILNYYPDRTTGFHLTGGAGAFGFRATEGGSALTSLTAGVSGGIGHDIPLGSGGVAVTPYASLLVAPRTRLHFNGETAVGGATLALLHAGIGLTWH